jgi:hypothetical protein
MTATLPEYVRKTSNMAMHNAWNAVAFTPSLYRAQIFYGSLRESPMTVGLRTERFISHHTIPSGTDHP